MIQLIGGFTDIDRPSGHDLGTQLGVGGEHTMESYEVEPGPWHKRCQALHERQWRHDDVGGAILIRAFQLQYNVTGAVGFEPFIGDGRAGDVAAQELGSSII